MGGIIGTPDVTIERRLTALLTVAFSICAVLAAFWVSWRLTPATPPQYVGGNLLLSVCPALVVWMGRRSFSTAVVLAGVVMTIFALTAVFGVHCRYFLATPPRSIFVLLGIFLSGFGWIALTLVWLRLSMRPSWAPVNQPRSLRLVSAFVVAVRVVLLSGFPFAALWLVDRPVILVVAGVAVFLLWEVTTNTIVIRLLRRFSCEPDAAAVGAVKEVERRCGRPAPMELLWLSDDVPLVCEVRLELTGRHTLLCSRNVARLLQLEELVALLAHEWAHVSHNHLKQKVLSDGATWVAVCGIAVLRASGRYGRRRDRLAGSRAGHVAHAR